MKIIITGGSGLIGTELARSLVENGHSVIILTRNPERHSNSHSHIQWLKWDGVTSDGWGHLADGADAVVNLAGSNLSAGRWTAARKEEIQSSRVKAGMTVTQYIREAQIKPKVLIQSSGVGAYGVNLSGQYEEESPYGNDYLASVCKVWEASTQPVEKLGVRRVVIRNGVVFTLKAGALPRMLLPFKFFLGGPLGSGKQWIPWIHWKDEVRAIKFLIENPRAEGIINLTAVPITNQSLAKTIGKVLVKPSIFPVPAFIIKLLFGEMATLVLDGQNAVNHKLIGLGFQFEFGNAELALRELLSSHTQAN